MSKKLRSLLFIALSFAGASALALPGPDQPVARPPIPNTAAGERTSPRPGRTPLETIFLPQLQSRLKSHPAPSVARSAGAAPQASGVASLTPNFGGYVSAPYIPGRLESSCIVDPYNCGVAAILNADFDKDGKPDLAVLQFDGTLNILLNQGGGSFAPIVSYANPNVSTSSIQNAFAVDVNNDGYPDILAFDGNNNAMVVFLNLKNGTFASPVASNLSFDFGTIGTVAVGDVNGDGNLDVVTMASDLTNTSKVTVQSYLGDGSGHFQPATAALTQTVSFPAQVQFNPSSIGLADLNHDGKVDIAAVLLEYTSQTTGQLVVTVASGNGDGSFSALNVNNPVSIPSVAPQGAQFLSLQSTGVQIVDLNSDSNLDLAFDATDASFNTNVYVALGDGNGNFPSVVQTPNVFSSQQLVFADVNGDGKDDMVQTNGTLNIWIGKGDGTFSLPADGNTYTEDPAGGQNVAVLDFNGDGNPDIALLGLDYKQISLYAGNGKGVFNGAPTLSPTTDNPTGPLNFALQDVVDVQGKGNSSAVFVDFNGSVVTGVGDGKGNFTYVTGLPASAIPQLGFIEPVQADFNGDGRQDILIAGNDGTLSVAFSNGDGTFQNPQSLGLPALNCRVNYAAAADLNGDGITDVVAAYPGDASCGGTGSTASGYFVVLGAAGGTFSAPTFTTYGAELYAVTIADMNLDGKPDLVLDDAPFQVGGTFAVFLLNGNGDGTFGAGGAIYSNYLVSQVIAGDYNQDGKPDLILLSQGEASVHDFDTTAGVFLLPGNADGTFDAATQLGSGNFFLQGSLTDVNNDGIPDLVLALTTSVAQPKSYYGLSTLLGEGGGAFSAPINALESLASALPLPGNFYADNAPDFIVATAYGTSLYLGQGGTEMTLTSSASSLPFGTPVTLTATVAASMSNRPTPSGSIAFYDGTTLLGSAQLTSGSAAYSTSALAAGSHSIHAVYAGDPNFNPNTSTATALAITAVAPAFTLSANPGTTTVSSGHNGVATLTLTANSTFSGQISLSCSGAPANASCAVNPGMITLAPGGSATATLIVGTVAGSSAMNSQPMSEASSGGVITLAALFGLFCRRNRKALFLAVSFAAVGVFGLGLTGCGSSGSRHSSLVTAAPGTYTISVTATPPSGTGISQTATVSMTVN